MAYVERDITRDPAAIQELRDMQAMGTPVIVIDGQAVHGFDQRRIEQLLDARRSPPATG